MVSQLKELYTTSSNQYQIFAYSGNKNESIDAMCKVAKSGFANPNSIALGLSPNGDLQFFADANELALPPEFKDTEIISKLNTDKENGIEEG